MALLEGKDLDEEAVSSIIVQARGRLADELKRANREVTQTDSHTTTVPRLGPACSKSFESQSVTGGDSSPCQFNQFEDSFLVQYSAGWVCARTLSHGVDAMEKSRHYGRACELLQLLLDQEVFCCSWRGHWWERLALDRDHHLHQRNKVCVCVCVCVCVNHFHPLPLLLSSPSLFLQVSGNHQEGPD